MIIITIYYLQPSTNLKEPIKNKKIFIALSYRGNLWNTEVTADNTFQILLHHYPEIDIKIYS